MGRENFPARNSISKEEKEMKPSLLGAALLMAVLFLVGEPISAQERGEGVDNKHKDRVPKVSWYEITSLDNATGKVTAKEIRTGRTIIFQVKPAGPVDGAKLTQILKVGGKVGLLPVDGAVLKTGGRVHVTAPGVGPVDGILASLRAP